MGGPDAFDPSIPVQRVEFESAKDRLLSESMNAPILRSLRPAAIPATLAVVGRYPQALTGLSNPCESTLAFGYAATNQGTQLDSSFSLISKGQLRLSTPKLNNETELKHIFVIKYLAEGQVIYDKAPVRFISSSMDDAE